MVAPPGALRWATRSASFVIPGCFGAVAFEFLRVVAFAARDPDFFLDDLLVMVFSSGIAAQIGAATGASPGWPSVVALTLLCAGKSSCPSYKFRPAQKSGPFRVVPDSVCDPHTILLHGVLSIFRNRAMRQLEIIAPRHQLDVLRRSSEACGRDTQNTRVSAPDGVYRRDNLLSQGKDFCVERRAVREDFDDLMHAGKGIRW